jgi:hypothetical protein
LPAGRSRGRGYVKKISVERGVVMIERSEEGDGAKRKEENERLRECLHLGGGEGASLWKQGGVGNNSIGRG